MTSTLRLGWLELLQAIIDRSLTQEEWVRLSGDSYQEKIIDDREGD